VLAAARVLAAELDGQADPEGPAGPPDAGLYGQLLPQLNVVKAPFIAF
jgi:hypothetical protein